MSAIETALGLAPLAYLKLLGPPKEEDRSLNSDQPNQGGKQTYGDSFALKLLTYGPAMGTWVGVRSVIQILRFDVVPFETLTKAVLRDSYVRKLTKICQRQRLPRPLPMDVPFQQAFGLREFALMAVKEVLLWGVVSPYIYGTMILFESDQIASHIHNREELEDFFAEAENAYILSGKLTFVGFGLSNIKLLFLLANPASRSPLSSVARQALLEAINKVQGRVESGAMKCHPGLLKTAEAGVRIGQAMNQFSVFSEMELSHPISTQPTAPVVDIGAVGAVGGVTAGVLLLRHLAMRGMTSPNPLARASGLAAAAALYIFSGESLQLEDMVPHVVEDGGA